VNESILHQFYGFGVPKQKQFNWRYNALRRQLQQQLAEDEPVWAELNKINVSTFVQKTAPTYLIKSCTINQMDCVRFWRLRQTFLGTCLELNPTDVLQEWEKVAGAVKMVNI